LALAFLAAGLSAAATPALATPGRCPRAGDPAPVYALNPALLDLPKGRWIKIHQQRPGDAVTFTRQKHAGSAFDSRRGRLILFGSDTHATGDWTNSPLVFDLQRLEWRRLYGDDDTASYTVTADGIPVAGPAANHPWAMHTFGALAYDAAADALIVASYPRHMTPGRFTDALQRLWPRIRRHPTWVLHLDTGRWQALAGDAVHFFPYAVAFDSRRCIVVGLRNDGIYELSLEAGRWRKMAPGGLLKWGNTAAYDSRNRVLVSVTARQGRASVVLYDPATRRARVMPTPGVRPSRARYLPLAYHPDMGRIVAVVDSPSAGGTGGRAGRRAETWLYDAAKDTWTKLPRADLPFGVGMNYNLQFDPGHRILLLVADPPGAAVAVWALRL